MLKKKMLWPLGVLTSMEFKYVYSTSRVKTISYKLLSENQLERLIGAKSLDEVFKVLQDTFLESFVTSKVTDISPVLENCLSQAKVLLSSVAPKPQMINLLWIEFDFFNLKISSVSCQAESSNGVFTKKMLEQATIR